MILVLDNYDSFVYNLARYFERLGQPTQVVRNDAIDATGVLRLRPDAIVLSPGPCTPRQAGCSLDVVRQCWERIPILGVCLGHQTIGAAWGANIVRAREPIHGRTSPIFHHGRGIFAGLPSPLTAGRYHSLVVEAATLPECLEVTASAADGTVMALQHRTRPVVGVQFHPESILTPHGYALLAAFLRLARVAISAGIPGLHNELAGCPAHSRGGPETLPRDGHPPPGETPSTGGASTSAQGTQP
jgi:anthranilate synthase/aminodeoxychorismate synthase-like glutamine amidotransferase